MRNPLSATLAIALATSSFALAGAAHAKANQIKFGDLDLDTPQGRASLDTRIRTLSARMCAGEVRSATILGPSACREAVRKEVLAQVEKYQNNIGKGG